MTDAFDTDLFAQRLSNVETSAIRELFKVLGKPGIISFGGGFPDPNSFDVAGVAQAAQQALNDHPVAALQYGATEGYEPLREQLCALMANKDAAVKPDELIVTTGSQQALDLIGKTLINPGDKVIVEGPTFLATIQCFRLYGAELITVPVDDNGVDVGALEALIAQHKPKFVYLIPTYGNPSGATLSLERRKRLLDVAVQTRTLVVEDDPYGDLYFDKAPPPSLLALSAAVPGSRNWLVHASSLSKNLSPGLRIGWMVAPKPLLDKAAMCKQFSDANTSSFAQVTAAVYLSSGRLGPALQAMRAIYAKRALCMCDALQRELGDAISFVRPLGGLFVWAKLTGAHGASTDSGALAKRAIEEGVAFVPGAPFFATHPDTTALRLSFASMNEEQIEAGVRKLKKALLG